MIDLQSCRVQH